MKRTYQENKSLYESIMMDVARIVKRHLNEDSYDSWKSGTKISASQFSKKVDTMISKNHDIGLLVVGSTPEKVKKLISSEHKFLIMDGANLDVNDFVIPVVSGSMSYEVKLNSLFNKYDGIIVRDIDRVDNKMKNMLMSIIDGKIQDKKVDLFVIGTVDDEDSLDHISRPFIRRFDIFNII